MFCLGVPTPLPPTRYEKFLIWMEVLSDCIGWFILDCFYAASDFIKATRYFWLAGIIGLIIWLGIWISQ